jgi:hypothetical protein
MVEGTTFGRACAQCRARVMVAPSGRALLARNPETIVKSATNCAMANLAQGGGNIELAGTVAEIVNEVSTAQPNIWRKRN